MTQLPDESRYRKILNQLKRQMAQGVVRAQRELEYQKLLTYWGIGKTIAQEFFLDTKAPVGLIDRLADDLNLHRRTLQETVRVYQLYPQKPKNDGLTFSHYVMLGRVDQTSKRNRLKERILKENLTNTDLRQIFRQWQDGTRPGPRGRRLDVKRGKLYHYRTRQVTSLHTGEPVVEIDCGFDIGLEKPPGKDLTILSLSRGKVVASTKTEEGYRIIQPKPKPSLDVLYTYKAVILKIVDADTLLVKIDVGFGISIRQRLRLQGIDAPELGTIDGDRAKAYMEKCLADVDFVVIKTYGSDKFDRYLVDVFYLPGKSKPQDVARKGRLLNQELLDEGLAQLYK